jgi:O-antigen/teichoic acid export membrane protein
MTSEDAFGDVSDRARRGFRNLSKMTAGRGVTQLVLIVSAIAIPVVLGAEAFGRYAALMAVVVILEVISSGGLHLAEIRFFAPMWQDGDREEAVVLGSSIWVARLSLAVLGGMIGLVWIWVSNPLHAEWPLVLAVALLITVRSSLEASRQLFLSLGLVGRMVVFEALRGAVTLVVVVSLFTSFGLNGVFLGLVAAQGALLGFVVATLRTAVPLEMRRARWSALKPMLPFSALTLVGLVAWIAQAQFSVYAVANWVSLRQAAVVGITVQIYVMSQTLLISPWGALMPILAEIDTGGERDRLREWAGTIMRWGVAAAVFAALTWSLIGDQVLRLLPAEFAAAHVSGTIMMAAVVPLAAAAAANNILYVGGWSGTASANQVVFVFTTLIGTALVIGSRGETVANGIAWVYLIAALAFLVVAYATLVWRRNMWLPLRRTGLLALPAFLSWPAVGWHAGLGVKLAALVFAGAIYAAYGVGLGLLPLHEVRRIKAIARSKSAPPPADATS